MSDEPDEDRLQQLEAMLAAHSEPVLSVDELEERVRFQEALLHKAHDEYILFQEEPPGKLTAVERELWAGDCIMAWFWVQHQAEQVNILRLKLREAKNHPPQRRAESVPDRNARWYVEWIRSGKSQRKFAKEISEKEAIDFETVRAALKPVGKRKPRITTQP